MSVPEMSADEAAEEVVDGALLLDVRELDEWTAGHAPDAQLMSMTTLPEHVGELPRDREILVICRTGSRSERVTAFLVAQGFDAHNVFGGLNAWAASGHEVVTDDGQPGAVI
jgi:rhodanese-related sulfurtransferase